MCVVADTAREGSGHRRERVAAHAPAVGVARCHALLPLLLLLLLLLPLLLLLLLLLPLLLLLLLLPLRPRTSATGLLA